MSSIPADDPLSNDHFRAEVSKLLAETAKIQAELHEVNARTAKIAAEANKFAAESRKLNAESKWYPFVVGAGLLAAGGALVKIFF